MNPVSEFLVLNFQVEISLASTRSFRVTASITDTVLLGQSFADDVVAVIVMGMRPIFVGMIVNFTEWPASPHTQTLWI